MLTKTILKICHCIDFSFQIQPHNNRNDCGAVIDISDYFHPSMTQDPWKHFQTNVLETSTSTNEQDDNSSPDSETKDEDGEGSLGST